MSSLLYKAVVLGGPGVGKSTTTIQFIWNKFVNDYDPTVENTYRKCVSIDGEEHMMDILDTAGEEEFNGMISSYVRSGEGFVLIYSITDLRSFDELGYYYNQILSVKIGDPIPIILVGNKCDLERQRKVETARGQELADEINCPFFEISAKERINIDECFHALLVNMKNNRIKNEKVQNQTITTRRK